MKTKNPKAKSWFEFRNAVGGRAEIAIMDEIGAFGVSAAAFKDALDSLPPTQPILLHICSDGGSITDGNEIYNALCAHPGGVEVEIGAIAASIASVIAMAGKPISMPENGFLMIHKPTGVTVGDSDDHRKNAEIMDKMQEGIAATYAKRTGKPLAEVSAMMDDETWMTADEALENGFIDSIRDDTDTNYVNFDLSKFRNSANFALRLQKQSDPAKELAGGKGGNTSASVTLSDLEEAHEAKAKNAGASAPPVHPHTLPKDKSTPMTDEEKAAQAKEIERLAREQAKELLKAQNKLHGEIDAAVELIKKRDKKDFSNAAGKLKQNGGSLDEFYRLVATSDEFKPVDVVGAGAEQIEVVDEFRGRNVTKGSPGEQFVNSAIYKAARDSFKNGSRNTTASVRTSMFTDALRAGGMVGSPIEQNSNDGPVITGFRNAVTESGLIQTQEIPGVYQLGVRPLKVKDVLIGGVTNANQIRYIKETAFTNAATTVAEGAQKPYGTVSVSQVTAAVQKIAALIKVTDELWADFPAVASLINMRLPYMVERTEEDQLLNGDGTGSNLVGLLNTSGIQTRAVGADTQADAIFKAGMQVIDGPGLQTGGYPWDFTIINPVSWQALRLAKDANNQYYGGGPFTGAYGNGPLVSADSFWGRPVVITPAIAPGTALVGSRLASQYFMRMGLMIESTPYNSTDFEFNLVTIRAEERLALIVPLPLGLCQVTGLATS